MAAMRMIFIDHRRNEKKARMIFDKVSRVCASRHCPRIEMDAVIRTCPEKLRRANLIRDSGISVKNDGAAKIFFDPDFDLFCANVAACSSMTRIVARNKRRRLCATHMRAKFNQNTLYPPQLLAIRAFRLFHVWRYSRIYVRSG
jgi:hypothetical protein